MGSEIQDYKWGRVAAGPKDLEYAVSLLMEGAQVFGASQIIPDYVWRYASGEDIERYAKGYLKASIAHAVADLAVVKREVIPGASGISTDLLLRGELLVITDPAKIQAVKEVFSRFEVFKK